MVVVILFAGGWEYSLGSESIHRCGVGGTIHWGVRVCAVSDFGIAAVGGICGGGDYCPCLSCLHGCSYIAKQGKATPWETKQLERIVRDDPAKDIWLSIGRDDNMALSQQV